jgi:hypothetical protein
MNANVHAAIQRGLPTAIARSGSAEDFSTVASIRRTRTKADSSRPQQDSRVNAARGSKVVIDDDGHAPKRLDGKPGTLRNELDQVILQSFRVGGAVHRDSLYAVERIAKRRSRVDDGLSGEVSSSARASADINHHVACVVGDVRRQHAKQ